MRSLKSLTLAACALLGLVVPLAMASPAWALCDADHVIYEFKNVSTTSRATNIASDWMEAGMTAQYSESRTAELNASMSATVEVEGGVIFAKASVAVGVTVGASYAKSQTWSYTSRPVPAGKEGRLVLYHEGRSFTVVKKVLRAPCSYVQVYSQHVDAPIKRNSNVWKLQLRSARRKGSAPQMENGDDIDGGGVTEIDEGPAIDVPDGSNEGDGAGDEGEGGAEGQDDPALAPDEPEALGRTREDF